MVNERLYLSSLLNKEDSNIENKNIFKSIIQRVKKVSYSDLIYDEKESKNKSSNNKCHVFLLPKDIHDDIIKVNGKDNISKKFESYPYGVDTESFSNFYRTHMDSISSHLKGLGFGYKLYKATAMRLGHLSSENDASDEAKNVWQYLARDDDFYTVLTNRNILIINKKLDKEEIEEIVFRFINKKLKIKKQVFDKDNYRKLKLSHVVYIDKSLCELFSEYRLERLNINYVEKYIKIHNSKFVEVNNKVDNPTIGQKVVTKNSKEVFKISKINRIGVNEYEISNRNKTENLKRSEFYVIDDRVPRISKSLNTEKIFNNLYINPFKFNKDSSTNYNSDSFFLINQIYEYCKEINFSDTRGSHRGIMDGNYLEFQKIDVNNDNIQKDYNYFVGYGNDIYIAKLIKIKSNGKANIELYNPSHWGGCWDDDFDLSDDTLTFYDKKIQTKKNFLKSNKKEISNLEEEMLNLMNRENRRKNKKSK
jgi:hypothetical protein